MSFFEDKDLVIRTSTLDDADLETILIISFAGIHDHRWPAGKRIQEFVEREIREARPTACLFDFLGYDYTFGNEIGGPIMAVLIYGGVPPPPIAIVAKGGTARSLKSLFSSSNLDKITEIGFFEDAKSARAFFRQTLEMRQITSSSKA